jgi:hypothetical protein
MAGADRGEHRIAGTADESVAPAAPGISDLSAQHGYLGRRGRGWSRRNAAGLPAVSFRWIVSGQ